MSEASPLQRAARLSLVGLACSLVALLLALHDLSSANRPHELRWAPLVLALLVASLVTMLATVRRLPVAWRERGLRRRPSRLLWLPPVLLCSLWAALLGLLLAGLVRALP